MRIAYKFASRSRPLKAMECVNNIHNLSDSNQFDIYLTVDKTDNRLREYFNIKGVDFIISDANNKVEAINYGLEKLRPFDILICMSDDMLFTKKGFDNIIREEFKESKDLFIHFQDGNRDDLATMSIIGIDYFNRDKYIYHPSYMSLFCDNEAQEVAIIRNRYRFIDKKILSHNHPAYGKSSIDELYIRNESLFMIDKNNYEYRKSNNFFIDTIH